MAAPGEPGRALGPAVGPGRRRPAGRPVPGGRGAPSPGPGRCAAHRAARSRWPSARSLDELREALAPAAAVLDGVSSPEQLWVAEAALWTSLADGGARLLRGPLAGPEHVVGAMAVLAADAFRVSAALAAAATGSRSADREVLGGAA